MKCPLDNTELVMSERQGIEIDYCPQCRGVWLDRGELDKIIERSAVPEVPPARDVRQEAPRYSDSHHDGGRPYKKKRESFLGELFDF